MSSYTKLKELQPHLITLKDDITTAFICTAKLVNGSIWIQKLRFDHVVFYACTDTAEKCNACSGILGLSTFNDDNGYWSPFNPKSGAKLFLSGMKLPQLPVLSIDLNIDSPSYLILEEMHTPAVEWMQLAGPSDGFQNHSDQEIFWDMVKVKSLQIGNKLTEWVTHAQPHATYAMLDTGGGLAFLTKNGAVLPVPIASGDCQEFNLTNDDDDYQACTCYFDPVAFELEGAVHATYPLGTARNGSTLQACAQVTGQYDGSFVNLGTYFFVSKREVPLHEPHCSYSIKSCCRVIRSLFCTSFLVRSFLLNKAPRLQCSDVLALYRWHH